jgi:hypothetical protein
MTTNILTSTTQISSTTTTFTTTSKSLIPVFKCEFSSNLCFQDSELIITNGTEFISDDINESPRAPLSDVTSTSKSSSLFYSNQIYTLMNITDEPTNNNETCQLPYQLSMHNSTNTTSLDMWFCYKNECPTKTEELSTCKSGKFLLNH